VLSYVILLLNYFKKGELQVVKVVIDINIIWNHYVCKPDV